MGKIKSLSASSVFGPWPRKRKKKPGSNLKAECVGAWTAVWGFLVLCCLLKMLQEPCGPMKSFIWMNSKKNALVGSVQNVKKKLFELANYLEIDELVIITWTHDHAVQRRSYELLAEAFNLQNQSIAA